jgi:phospholipid-transporting ATPase
MMNAKKPPTKISNV